MRLVHISASWLDAEDKEQAFTLKHLPLLDAKMQELKPRLVVLDPIQSFFGDVDMHRANQTRPLLDALSALAEAHNCAIVCIRHPAKPGEGIGKALHRGLGSVDLIGAARTGLFIEQYPGDDTRAFMAQTKSNLGPKGRTQVFSKKEGVFAWEGVTRLTAEDLAGSGRGPTHTTFLEAVLWLEARLEGRLPCLGTVIEKEAAEQDIAATTLRRAKKALGVVSTKGHDKDDVWTWFLPPLPVPTPLTSTSSSTSSTSTTSTSLDKSTSYECGGLKEACQSEGVEDVEEVEEVEEVEVSQVVSEQVPALPPIPAYDYTTTSSSSSSSSLSSLSSLHSSTKTTRYGDKAADDAECEEDKESKECKEDVVVTDTAAADVPMREPGDEDDDEEGDLE